MFVLAGVLAFIAPFVAWLVQAQRIASYVQARHPDVFEMLGKPHLLRNNTPTNNAALLGFILGKNKELGDDGLARLCRTGRILFFTAIAFFVLGGGTILLTITKHQ